MTLDASASGTAPAVSVVLPIFNEEEIVARSIAEVVAEMQRAEVSFELVCVDDGSSDRSGAILESLAARDRRIVPVRLSRNFGKESALSAGLETARGSAVLLMDADLQHPPDVIPQMLKLWRDGYDVVNAVKELRGDENSLYKLMSGIFYLLIGRAVAHDLRGSSDFKLLDRQVVDALRKCPERARFFRGLVAWVGFRVAQVPFEVQERRGGRTKWTPLQLVAYSVRNLIAFSSTPLRTVAWVGFLTVGAGALLGIKTLHTYFFSDVAVSGYTTVILLMLILCGFILISLGIVAFYLAMLYEEQKARPLFVIRHPRLDEQEETPDPATPDEQQPR